MKCKSLIFAAVLFLGLHHASAQVPSMIDVGGYKLEVIRTGSGGPAIVLVAGLNNDLTEWKPVITSLGEFSTVIAFSRAGLGRSEGADRDHSANAEVSELHTLVEKLGLKRPLVLVGASYGGILVRLYTSEYPSEVAGLVFVDATSEDQVKRYGKLDPSYPDAFRKSFEDLLKTQKGAEAAETRESLRIQMAGTVEGIKPLPDMPMAILTSMQPNQNAQYVNQSVRGYAEWRAMHEEWFNRSSNAMHIETSKAGHHIMDDEPELVIEAIRFVLDRVRTQ
jgi:Predicted hydrolases or acyltransferases (alpha/beta hydrolase superfamily)